MRDWVTNVQSTHYLLGSALGAHPYPMMVRDFHRVIGEETRRQILEREHRLPDSIFACVGGGSNAIGMFHPFLGDPGVRLIGVEAGGRGAELGLHAARFSGGSPGVLHGAFSYLLQDADGQVSLTHSVSAGLDYALVGPEHAWLRDQGRTEYVSVTDQRGARSRAHAGAHRRNHPGARVRARGGRSPPPRARSAKNELFVINLSGRGDKDTDIYRENLQELDEPDQNRPAL